MPKLPLVVVPAGEERAAHVPVCPSCAEPWPCAIAQRVQAEKTARRPSGDCWACGNPAQSLRAKTVIDPRGGLVLAVFCGPATDRVCSDVADLYLEADLRFRMGLDITPGGRR